MAALYAALTSVAPEISHLSDRDRALVLRDEVCTAVDELRATGRTSAGIVALIKSMAVSAGMDDVRDADAIEHIAAWCVKRYYGS